MTMTFTSAPPARRPQATAPPLSDMLQGRCARGTSARESGECRSCADKKEWLQRKPAMGSSDDPLEKEADRAAEQVASGFSRSDFSTVPLHLGRSTSGPSESSADEMPASARRTLARSGRPLEPQLRRGFEQRFGRDFSRVRVHRGSAAEQSAEEVGARAYAVGSDVVFGKGQYAPETGAGLRLLAHELAHVVQQSGAGPRLQRACGPHALGALTPDCAQGTPAIGGKRFMFSAGCDDLLPGEQAKLNMLRSSAAAIHGFASQEGPAAFNLALSCHRANQVARLIRTHRPDIPITGVFKHGEYPPAGPGTPPDRNPPAYWRTVIVDQARPVQVRQPPSRPQQQPEPQPAPNCGPDATDWFIQQVAMAKRNARVLHVRGRIDAARHFATLTSSTVNVDAMRIAEGAMGSAVSSAWYLAGSPHFTPDAVRQLAAPDVALGVHEGTLAALASAVTSAAQSMLVALYDAATGWQNLVGSGRPYDFKVDPGTLGSPRSAHCPTRTRQCRATITLCPGSPGSNCFGKDLPGNLFYAHLGRFIGFSENTLQLGSQFAQLRSARGRGWDPPEDTAAISIGFHLPDPLTRPGFCSALQSAKARVPNPSCLDCSETPAGIRFVDP